jgi:Uma2 family endonuclease
LCELVDGVLVEKTMGQRESRLAFWLGSKLGNYLDKHDLGIAFGADGPSLLDVDQVRFPDLAFISYDRIPEDADPDTPMPDWVPNLAIEVISPGNTRGEMTRKLRDYFEAGVELVWYIDPAKRTVRVYTAVDHYKTLREDATLDGGHVLPGFEVSIRELFRKASKIRPGRS